jgi:hypothetical protein
MVKIFPESSRVNDSLLKWGISLVLKRCTCTAESRVEFPNPPPFWPKWCNGSHASLRNLFRKEWGFKSLLGHFLILVLILQISRNIYIPKIDISGSIPTTFCINSCSKIGTDFKSLSVFKIEVIPSFSNIVGYFICQLLC